MLGLLSIVSDPLIVLCSRGDIKFVNGAMQDLLRLSDRELIDKSISRYISAESFETLTNVGMVSAETQVYRAPVELVDGRREIHRTEARLMKLSEFVEFNDCYALLLGREPSVVRKSYEADAADTPHRVRVREHGAGLIFHCDAGGVIHSVTDEALIVLVNDKQSLTGQVIWEIDGWSESAEFAKEFKRCMHALADSDKQYMPARYESVSAGTVWFELCVSRSGQGYQVEGYDVTSRVVTEMSQKHYTSRLAQLSRQLIRAQESERRRIAQELHDQIGQLLTALRLGLHSVKHNVGDDMKARIDMSMETVDRVLGHVRSLSLDLRPAMLDDLGLGAALNWFGARHSELTGLRIEVFSDHLEKRLPNTVEVASFRIVQEAVTNALRHSQSDEIHISMRFRDGVLELQVEDFGVGFDAQKVWKAASGSYKVGLENMQQRVALVGGELNIDSKEGRGSRVRVRIPIS